MTILTGREKPLDFGGGGITGSLDLNGRIIALNCYHPVHGYVTLTSAPTFPDSERYNPAAVRAYRASLAKLEGFGMQFDSPVVQREVELIEDEVPRIKLTFANGGTASVITHAYGPIVYQTWKINNVEAYWGGFIELKRCAYTQLTEGGVIPFPSTQTDIRYEFRRLNLENGALSFGAVIAGFPKQCQFQISDNGKVIIKLPLIEGEIIFGYSLETNHYDKNVNYAKRHILGTPYKPLKEGKQFLSFFGIIDIPNDPILRRGLIYSRIIAINNGTVCLLTDHMLLPLVWNRDAYYVARASLHVKSLEGWFNVARHLDWILEDADRPNGYWGRCYLANGKIKDHAFQLDQQLFPLLEFADFLLTKPHEKGFRRSAKERLEKCIKPILALLLSRKAPHAALFPTDETPGDDPIVLPYHLSSHILFWYTLNRLKQAGLGDWSDLAAQIREAIDQHFIAEHNGQRIYAYATDGAGKHHFYHDANDFPLVLAPWWGFCSADDPVLRATIDFAWSEANKGGCYGGRLGSVHTPGAWPLGDVQELIVAQVTNDPEREAKVRANLRAAAFWDGALPEAVDPVTNECISRTWFAWPNAAYACVELGAFKT